MKIIGPNTDHSERSSLTLPGLIGEAGSWTAFCGPRSRLRSAGVYRGTFAAFVRMDEERMVAAARRVEEG